MPSNKPPDSEWGPDPIEESRRRTAGDPAPPEAYVDPVSGRTTFFQDYEHAPVVVTSDRLDNAILELKQKAPDALEIFVELAIRKNLLYMAHETEDTSLTFRRVGAANVASEVDRLIHGAEQRVEQRLRIAAERDRRRRNPG